MEYRQPQLVNYYKASGWICSDDTMAAADILILWLLTFDLPDQARQRGDFRHV